MIAARELQAFARGEAAPRATRQALPRPARLPLNSSRPACSCAGFGRSQTSHAPRWVALFAALDGCAAARASISTECCSELATDDFFFECQVRLLNGNDRPTRLHYNATRVRDKLIGTFSASQSFLIDCTLGLWRLAFGLYRVARL